MRLLLCVLMTMLLTLAGCAQESISEMDEAWFCSVRAGNLREVDIYMGEWKVG